jgi:hypothetical protein
MSGIEQRLLGKTDRSRVILKVEVTWFKTHRNSLKPHEVAKRSIEHNEVSSYPSIFLLVCSFLSGFVASHCSHSYITVSSCISGDLF